MYEMTDNRKLSEISGLGRRVSGKFHRLPSDERRRVLSMLDTITASNLEAAVEKVKRSKNQ